MIQFKEEVLHEAVENLKKRNRDAAYHRAIDRALVMLEGNPYVQWTDEGLLIMSNSSSEIYLVALDCNCKASKQQLLCKHKVAYDIVLEYNRLAETWDAKQRATVNQSLAQTAVAKFRDRRAAIAQA